MAETTPPAKPIRTMRREKGASGNIRACPTCGTPMVATKVMRSPQRPGGMYWICPKDDHRERI